MGSCGSSDNPHKINQIRNPKVIPPDNSQIRDHHDDTAPHTVDNFGEPHETIFDKVKIQTKKDPFSAEIEDQDK